MPRINALPPITEDIADADVFPIHNDSTGDTEKTTFTQLKTYLLAWLQGLATWISLSNIKDEVLMAMGVSTSTQAFAPGNSNNYALTNLTATVVVPSGSPDLAITMRLTVNHKSGNAGYGFHAYIYKDGVQTWSFISNTPGTTSSSDVRGYTYAAKDTAVSAGSHTYAVYVAVAGSTSASVDFRAGCSVTVEPIQ